MAHFLLGLIRNPKEIRFFGKIGFLWLFSGLKTHTYLSDNMAHFLAYQEILFFGKIGFLWLEQ
jgi:hypothetical protein